MTKHQDLTDEINAQIAARDILNATLVDLQARRKALGFEEDIVIVQDKDRIREAVQTLLDDNVTVALIVVREERSI